MMLLYGSTNSGHTYKVRLFLLLASISHDYVWIDLNSPRAERPVDFRNVSKFGEVPVLIDSESVLCQSNAILIHLAKKTGFLLGKPGEWSSVLEWLSWESNRVGFSVPNLRYALRWAHQPPDVLEYLKSRAQSDLETLNSFLSQTEYLVPSGPSVADLSCSAYLYWLDQAELSVLDYPNVQRWLSALRKIPGWRHPDDALQPDLV